MCLYHFVESLAVCYCCQWGMYARNERKTRIFILMTYVNAPKNLWFEMKVPNLDILLCTRFAKMNHIPIKALGELKFCEIEKTMTKSALFCIYANFMVCRKWNPISDLQKLFFFFLFIFLFLSTNNINLHTFFFCARHLELINI